MGFMLNEKHVCITIVVVKELKYDFKQNKLEFFIGGK